MVKGSSIVTAVVQVQSLAWELPHAGNEAKKKKKRKLKVLNMEKLKMGR